MSTPNTQTTPITPNTQSTPKNPFASFATFDPYAVWTQMFTDACSNAQAFAEHYATLERDAATRAQSAVATWSQLAQDAIAYGAQVSAETRKLALAQMQAQRA